MSKTNEIDKNKKNGGKRPGSGAKKKPEGMKRVAAIVYVQSRLKEEFMTLAVGVRDELEKEAINN